MAKQTAERIAEANAEESWAGIGIKNSNGITTPMV